MAAFLRQHLTAFVAPVGGALSAFAAGMAIGAMPIAQLEGLVVRSGIDTLVAAAQPPLGQTARLILTIGAGAAAGLVVWSALFLLFGAGGVFAARRTAADDGLPVLRRADAHPDAPARKPMSASDLGAPMPPVVPPVIQPIPQDLDQPLSAFDPSALLPVPMEPAQPVRSLRAPMPLVEGERITTVELPPAPRAGGEAPSIESLLRRLEQGARPRTAAAR